MKKLLLIPVILFVILTKTFAQDCKWDENKKDPISDAKYIKSEESKFIKGELISPGTRPGIKSYIELKEGKVSLFVLFEVSPMVSLEKVLNPALIIKLTDGSKIEIASSEQFSLTYPPYSKVNNGATSPYPGPTYADVNLKWIILNDDVKKIGASKIVAIRISFAGQDYSFIPDDKQAQQLLTMFSCMNKEL